MKSRVMVVAAAIAALAAAPVQAQMAVYDATSYAQILQQAKTALLQLQRLETQVQQGQQLLNSLNVSSNVNAIASQLSTPQLRQFLPDITKYEAAVGSDFSSLGDLGTRASQIRAANRILPLGAGSTQTQADKYYTDALEQSGDRAARDMALGESVGDVGAQRLQGLEQLRQSLDTAPDARAVLDLQARISVESAAIQNDQMRLQGMVMVQQTQDRLQTQRDREEAMRASQLRLSIYQQGFQ